MTFAAKLINSSGQKYLSHADNASLSVGDIDFSIACWIKLVQFPPSIAIARWGLLGKADSVAQYEWSLSIPGSSNPPFNITFTVGNGATTTNIAVSTYPGELVMLETWNFIAAVRDKTAQVLKLSVNGGLTKSLNIGSFVVMDSTAIFYIGHLGVMSVQNADSFISQVGFWKRTLTDADIAALWNNGQGLFYADLSAGLKTNLTSWWDLQEFSGTRKDSVVASGNDLTDNNGVSVGVGIRRDDNQAGGLSGMVMQGLPYAI